MLCLFLYVGNNDLNNSLIWENDPTQNLYLNRSSSVDFGLNCTEENTKEPSQWKNDSMLRAQDSKLIHVIIDIFRLNAASEIIPTGPIGEVVRADCLSAHHFQ